MSVNGAAAKRPRKERLLGRLLCVAGGVNGAAAKRPRKGVAANVAVLAQVASMGPRPNGRGKGNGRGNGLFSGPASMGPRPNGRGKLKSTILEVITRGVNGAAAKRPRKVALPWVLAVLAWRRQWGRGQTAAESPARPLLNC